MLQGPRQNRNVSGLLTASILAAFCAVTTLSVRAAHAAADNDIPKVFMPSTANDDYVKREVMIPMRDGVKLYTVIVVPKGAGTRRFC